MFAAVPRLLAGLVLGVLPLVFSRRVAVGCVLLFLLTARLAAPVLAPLVRLLLAAAAGLLVLGLLWLRAGEAARAATAELLRQDTLLDVVLWRVPVLTGAVLFSVPRALRAPLLVEVWQKRTFQHLGAFVASLLFAVLVLLAVVLKGPGKVRARGPSIATRVAQPEEQ